MNRMNNMISLFRNIFTKSPSFPLGRWGIVYSPDKIGEKIDRSNEDHCYCNEYAKKKIVELKKEDKKDKEEKEDKEDLKNNS